MRRGVMKRCAGEVRRGGGSFGGIYTNLANVYRENIEEFESRTCTCPFTSKSDFAADFFRCMSVAREARDGGLNELPLDVEEFGALIQVQPRIKGWIEPVLMRNFNEEQPSFM